MRLRGTSCATQGLARSRRRQVNVFRAKAFECLSLAECMNNPEKRAEMVRFARVFMSFAEPIAEARGAYELPRRR
jgi:hypothetical protein